MKIFTAEQIRRGDKYTIENEPIASIDLMERAARALSKWIIKHFTPNTNFKIFSGPGNNGGDAWALARLLSENNYLHIDFYFLNLSGKISADSEINRDRLIKQGKVSVSEIKSVEDFPEINSTDVLIDGLFGSGLSRPLSGLPADLVVYINKSEKKSLVAIDIPSGLFCEDNSGNTPNTIIKANYTLSFQFPKFSFFLSDYAEFVKEYFILDIGISKKYISDEPSSNHYLVKTDIAPTVRKREKYSHKGSYGHGLLVAGSYGMMGAAILAAKSSLRSGIGLLTTHIPRFGYEIIQTAVPESLISIDESDIIFTEVNHLEKYTAIAVGPGIQKKHNTVKALEQILTNCTSPIILDADALNIISEYNLQNLIPKNAILTPHPKEFDRLFGKHNSHYQRVQKQLEKSSELEINIILKGAHTSISLPNRNLYFNTTGNPGMATGGSGDVLTGILLGLLAQGYSEKETCILGTYLHGLAADIVLETSNENSLLPTDIINSLGKAFNKLVYY